MKTQIRLLLKEQSDLGLRSFVSPISPNTLIFTVDNILKVMENIPREKYLNMVSESKAFQHMKYRYSTGMKYRYNTGVFGLYSNWLRLITLCENITLFWSCGPD